MPFFLFPSESLFDVGSLANASQDLATKSRIIFHVLASLQRPNQYTLPRFKKTTTSDTSESCLFFFFFWVGEKTFQASSKDWTEAYPGKSSSFTCLSLIFLHSLQTIWLTTVPWYNRLIRSWPEVPTREVSKALNRIRFNSCTSCCLISCMTKK